MDKIKQWIGVGWTWLKGRQKTTLLAGAAIGSVLDDPVFAIARAFFG